MGGVFMVGLMVGCQDKSQVEIEASFDQLGSLYPTKNLMDFYERVGIRDESFEADDEGVWSIRSGISIKKEQGAPLISEGMVLRLNRNTRTAKGFFYQRSVLKKENKKIERMETTYPVTYDEQGLCLLSSITDQELKEKIESFQFFVQYGNFKEWQDYHLIRKMYNSKVPMYELEYQLTKEDDNVQKLRERYDLSVNKEPQLLLKGRGSLTGDSFGYKHIEFIFDQEVDVFFIDSLDYQPVTEEDNL